MPRVDDGETSLILYSGEWSLGGVHREFNSTTHYTTTPGASFTFKFIGTSVSVFGTIPPSQPPANSTYMLDGSAAVTFAPLPDGNWHFQQAMYRSPNLSNIEHTLVVTSVDNLEVDKNVFVFDYLQYEAESLVPPVPLVSPVPSESPVPPNAGNPRNLVAEIVGGAIGGFALIVIALGFILWYRFRNATRPRERMKSIDNTEPVGAAPELYTPSSGYLPDLYPYGDTKVTGHFAAHSIFDASVD